MKQIGSNRKLTLRLAALLAALLVSAPAVAKGWTVDGTLIGKTDKEGKQKPSKDMSGIACATGKGFPRTCLVIDDDLQAAQIVILTDGKVTAGKPVPLIDDRFSNGEPVSLDGEGVAFAAPYFYVIGSHGRPRDEKGELSKEEREARAAAGLAAASKLVRLKYDAASGAIALEPGVAPSTALASLIAAEPDIARSRNTPLEDGGVTIEGIAISGGRLYAGFRGPLIKDDNNKDRALVLSAALGHFFEGKPAEAKLHYLKLGPGRGVRDLAAYDGGILVLAGPMKSGNGTYSVYRWSGAGDKVRRLADLPDYFSKKEKKKDRTQWKPEALLPLSRNDKGLRILLLLDSAEDGAPRSLRIPYP